MNTQTAVPAGRDSSHSWLASRFAGGLAWGRFDQFRELVNHGLDLLLTPTAAPPRIDLVVSFETDAVSLLRFHDAGPPVCISVHEPAAVDELVESLQLARRAGGLADVPVALAFGDSITLDLEQLVPQSSRRTMDAMARSLGQSEAPFGDDATLSFWTFAPAPNDTALARIHLLPADLVGPVIQACQERAIPLSHALRWHSWQNGPIAQAQPAWLPAQMPVARSRFAGSPSYVRKLGLALALLLGTGLAEIGYNHIQLVLEQPTATSARDAMRAAARVATDEQRIQADRSFALGLVHALDQLAERLPNESWLEQIDIDPTTLKLSGFAGSAAETLSLVSRIDGLGGGELLAAVSRDAQGKRERFKIGARFTAGKQP
jgi:Fimbrial assembly protein (PilN)